MESMKTPQDNPLKEFSDKNNMNYSEMRRLSGIPESTFFSLLKKSRHEFGDIRITTARTLWKYFKIKLIK